MKILLFDIETAPNLGYVWGKWEQDVIENEKDWYMLSFAYKWLDDKKVKAYSLPDFPAYKKDRENDKALVTKLWELFNEVDIIIAHNGDQFDIRKANARFMVHGLGAPSPYKTIDTKKVAKKYASFDSNKLDELGRYLGIGRKEQTGGFGLWKGCMSGDKKSWNKMVSYNKQDVILLEKVYLKLRGWMTNHPNVNLFTEEDGCPACGSDHVQKRGFSIAGNKTRQRFQCQDCGKWSLGELSKKALTLK